MKISQLITLLQKVFFKGFLITMLLNKKKSFFKIYAPGAIGNDLLKMSRANLFSYYIRARKK